MRAIVRGINMVKRHTRPTMKDAGGIISKEMPIHISNIAYFDEESGKASKLGYKIAEGKKVRYCKTSNKTIE
jgi:large subunit ribosomal protein L24